MTLGNILLGEKTTIKTKPLEIRPRALPKFLGGTLQVSFSITGATDAKVRVGLDSGDDTTRTTQVDSTGGQRTITLKIKKDLDDGTFATTSTRGFIYAETTVGTFEPVQTAAARITFTLTGANFSVTGLPDLTISNLSFPHVVVANKSTTLSVTVANIGDGLASASTLRIDVDGTPKTTKVVAAISSKGSVTLNIPLTFLTAVSHTVTATVDPSNKIEEITGANNSLSKKVTPIKASQIEREWSLY